MTATADACSAPIEVLAASGDGTVIAAHAGNLYISGEQQSVNRVCCSAVTTSGPCLVAAGTLDKEVVILCKNNHGDNWKQIAKHLLPKRPTAVAFSTGGDCVVVADAFGDVYMLPLEGSVSLRGDHDHGENLLLGHFSTVTAIALSESMIATADRDNKLRVSSFPNSFMIQSFCLAHSEFITCVRWIGPDRLISGAGDGTVRIWNAANGKLLHTLHIEDGAPDNPTDEDNTGSKSVVVCIEPLPNNSDAAVIGVHRASYVLVATGLRSHNARIHTALRFSESEITTGMAFDEKSRLWLSLESDCHSVRGYSLRGLEEMQPLLLFHESKQLRNRESLRSTHKPLAGDILRFDWLNQQRKREMVEDWKGKKRKHIEI